MILQQERFTLDRLVRLGAIAAVVLGLIWLLGYLADVMIPFAVAMLLAYLINPLVNLVQRKVTSRAGAVALSLLAITVAGLGVLVAVLPLVLREISHLGRLVSQLLSNSTLAAKAAERLPPDLWAAIRDYIARPEVQGLLTADNVYKATEKVSSSVLPGVWGIISGAASGL